MIEHCIKMSGRLFRPLILVFVLILLSACQGHSNGRQVYDQAEQAFSRGEYRLAKKLYQKYVQQASSGNKRWEAWQRLLVITRDISNNNQMAKETLETMYIEFRMDTKRTISILRQEIDLSKAMGDLKNAMEKIDEALGIQEISASQKWALLFTKGSLALRTHQYGLAKRSFGKAAGLAADKECRDKTLYGTGQSLMYMKKYGQARQVLEQAFADAQPGSIRARIGLALVDIAEHDGRYAEGLRILSMIREEYPIPKSLEIRQKMLQKKIQQKS